MLIAAAYARLSSVGLAYVLIRETLAKTITGFLRASDACGNMSRNVTTASPHDVTLLLQAWSEGDESALEKLAPLIYAELHRLARRSMQR